mgnify:CR=1 FL=1|jgi:hypothetical protein
MKTESALVHVKLARMHAKKWSTLFLLTVNLTAGNITQIIYVSVTVSAETDHNYS